MPTIELSAGTIDYLDTGGDGPVVVPVHGLIQDGTVWRDVVEDLRSLRLDRRTAIDVTPDRVPATATGPSCPYAIP